MGLFSGPEHSYITTTALGGTTAFPWLPGLVVEVDFLPGSQDPANAYWHAMSDALTGQTPDQAQTLYLQYVDQQIATCTQQGLARALHAVEDSAAEGHQGFQPWDGGTYGVPSWTHLMADWFPSDASVANAVEQAQYVLFQYEKTCPCQNASQGTVDMPQVMPY